MPAGVIFKSPKGWYMLGRDLTVRYIGAGVQAYDANSVCAAVVLEDRRECRFASVTGTQLIYSYLTDSWSTTVYRLNTGAGATTYTPSCAIWWHGVLSSGSASGVYVTTSTATATNFDSPGLFIDAPGGSSTDVAIVTTARTSWLHPSVMEGFQRIRKILLSGTAPTSSPTSTLTLSVDFDDIYGGAAPGAYSFTTAFGSITFASGNAIDIRTKLRRQKCKSVAFTFVDTPLTTKPAGVNFQALALEIGLKRGVKRLPAAQSVG